MADLLRRSRRMRSGTLILDQETSDALHRIPGEPTHDFRPVVDCRSWEGLEYDFEKDGRHYYIPYRIIEENGEIMQLYPKGLWVDYFSRKTYPEGHKPSWRDGWYGRLLGQW